MTDMDIQEQAARIARDIEESRKLSIEREKRAAEREKLFNEALKMERERSWLPITGVATLMGAAAVLGGLIAKFLGH